MLGSHILLYYRVYIKMYSDARACLKKIFCNPRLNASITTFYNILKSITFIECGSRFA